jgi:hypothetical protein
MTARAALSSSRSISSSPKLRVAGEAQNSPIPLCGLEVRDAEDVEEELARLHREHAERAGRWVVVNGSPAGESLGVHGGPHRRRAGARSALAFPPIVGVGTALPRPQGANTVSRLAGVRVGRQVEPPTYPPSRHTQTPMEVQVRTILLPDNRASLGEFLRGLGYEPSSTPPIEKRGAVRSERSLSSG